MKILIIAPNFLEPHAWMVSAYKTAKLLNKNHEIIVLTSKTKDSKKYEEIEGIKVHRMPCLFIGDPFNYTITPGLSIYLHKILKKEKPEKIIVSKNMFYTSFSIAILKYIYRRKAICQIDTFPGINWFAPSKTLNFILKIYSRTIGMFLLKISDKVIILHEGLITTSKKYKLNYQVIHNGVNLKKFEKTKPAKDILKYKQDKTLFTYVGRLDDVKGYQTLLKVAKELEQKTEIKFLFVCGNKHQKLQEELNNKYKNCKFIGFREDIPEIMKASDAYVMPSYAEGLPNTLMEAMASKIPSIASAVGGIKTLIRHRENGLLFNPGNKKELKKQILEIYKNKKLGNKLGKKGYETIKEGYSWDQIRKDWEKVLRCVE